MRKGIGIVVCLSLAVTTAFAQETGQQAAASADSIAFQKKFIKSNEFYDGLQKRSRSSEFTKFIVNAVIVDSDWTGEGAREATKKLIDETAYFSLFEGREIAHIYVMSRNIYGDSTTHFIPNLINSVHVKTREKKIRQNLLFKEGDKVHAATMILNEDILRRLRYIADAYIYIHPQEHDSSKVDLYVHTRDKWSINIELRQRNSKEYRMWVYDNNFLGIGHRLTLGAYAMTQNPVMPGYVAGYDVNNLWGSFFDAELLLDKSYDETIYQAQLQKALIKPNDYAAGMAYSLHEVGEGQWLTDTILPVKRQTIELWGGFSLKLKNTKNNIFLLGKVTDTKTFDYGGQVTGVWNPYYRSPTTALLSLGIYHENFYRGSHIYSFGVSEDIPYGYKLELSAGRTWDEYTIRNYFSLKWSIGHSIPPGYLKTSVAYGSYFCDDYTPQQSVLLADTHYFTHLFRAGKGYMRHFINVNYTAGFHRLEGERERITFYGDNGLRILKLPHACGLNRLSSHLESVYFSPFYFYNFKFALYGFCDLGWLGDSYKIFSNDFYTTVGLGIRILNDRLIFTSVQLQLGYAVINPGHGANQWIELGGEQRIGLAGFRPDKPALVDYH
ncbi:MAG: hypothetical protein LBF69_00540 [Prevotellaceae bacterium]|jgi:hypothetical protein|nr:hypothetical protein [Prevotellaceae bacterium]